VVVPYDDGAASAWRKRCEARRQANHAQVFMLEPYQRGRGPKSALLADLQAAVEAVPRWHHVSFSGWPMTSSGYPSFYIEEMTERHLGAGDGDESSWRAFSSACLISRWC
jgi:hypothetical protein